MFTGQNVQNITKIKQSDVFIKVHQTVIGTVAVPANLPAGDALKMGTLLRTNDGGLTWESLTTEPYAAGTYQADEEVYHNGHIYKSLTADNVTTPNTNSWADLGAWNPNGILYTDITETKKTTIVVTGDQKGKYLHGLDEYLKAQLFTNKLLVK